MLPIGLQAIVVFLALVSSEQGWPAPRPVKQEGRKPKNPPPPPYTRLATVAATAKDVEGEISALQERRDAELQALHFEFRIAELKEQERVA